MKNKIKYISFAFLVCLFISILSINVVKAIPNDKPSDSNSLKGGSNNSTTSISYKGASNISEDTTNDGTTYISSTGVENALLVSGGTSTLTSPIVDKSGDASGDNADFYGTNAAILVYNGATLNIKGGNITTNGAHANAVFAYSTGIINISDAVIKTTSNNSGAIMVTGGGTLTADNVTAETEGNSSAPIRSDRGGGTLTVNGGTYISHGTGSPVIYSTADIIVNNATLTSTVSEGVVVEGKNSVTLNGVTMEATNTKLNGNSETYKSIFIYQSMSGDAEVGTSTFTAKDSKITNNKGEIIFVTNTKTVITLENDEIINNDSSGGFLRVTTAKWGTSGSNGGNVTLNMTNQKVSGDIIVDSISTLNMTLTAGSVYRGSINNSNEAKKIEVILDSDSIIVLDDDSYIDSLSNEDSSNQNIYLNGHNLYVNGTLIEANSDEYSDEISDGMVVDSLEDDKIDNGNDYLPYIMVLGILVLFIIIIVLIIRKKNINSNKI